MFDRGRGRRACPRAPKIRGLCLGLLVATALLPASPASARDPQAGDYLVYYFARHVGDGVDEYEGYTDSTYSLARLDVLSTNATDVQVRSAYNWTYDSNEGDHEDGAVDRAVSFDRQTRRWTSSLTDDDDHDLGPASNFIEWFWIPTAGLKVGDTVEVLDDTYAVVSLRSTVWSSGLPRLAIEVRASGAFPRDDAYGQYWATYEDTYYYDAATGFVVAERYREVDRGTYKGDRAGFTWTETVDVIASSYPIEVDAVALGLNLTGVGLFFGLIAYTAYRIRWRSRTVDVGAAGSVRVQRVKAGSPAEDLIGANLARGQAEPSPNFAPLLGDFTRKALKAGDRVALAHRNGSVVGLAVLSKDANIGQVFARETTVAEALRRFVGARDFFSEFKHQVPSAAILDAAQADVPLPTGDAYNLMDEYLVLRLERFPGTSYDASLVHRMRPEDLPEVMSIARHVYKVQSSKWLKAQVATGDIGFVARVGGKVVGFAFASLVGVHGRLHTATVLPEHRNQGIGRELLRARLHALQALGAASVVTEIAVWNVPSLQLAFSHGFAKVDTMWVETTRRRRTKFGLQRR